MGQATEVILNERQIEKRNRMRIIFCNIAAMKKYQGITDNDKPKYCGSYITEDAAGADIFNFSEYNGKCYGYVLNEGDLILPDHLAVNFELSSGQEDTIEGVLVVWCAFRDKNTAKIVGWYKNAVLYREEQYQPSFTNPEYELDYYFEADSKDCYLLSEKQRLFTIERASKAGKGKGFGRSDIWFADSPYAQNELIPQVVKYIESYAGPRENFILTGEMINALPAAAAAAAAAESREVLIRKGLEFFEQENYLEALARFNAARQTEETPDVLYYTAFCLYNLAAFDKARVLLEKSLETGPDSLPAMELLAFCSDMTGDWDTTLKCLEKMIDLTKEEAAREVIRGTITEMHTYLAGEDQVTRFLP